MNLCPKKLFVKTVAVQINFNIWVFKCIKVKCVNRFSTIVRQWMTVCKVFAKTRFVQPVRVQKLL